MTHDDLLAAVKRGDLAAVRRGLAGDAALAATRLAGVSIVCTAVYAGQTTIAAELAAARGADLDIFEASCLGDQARVRQLLATAPELVDTRSADGFQPLGFACFFGHPEVLEVLLEHGADVDTPAANAMRVRPIHSAVAHADPAVARLLAERLLERGAPPNVAQQRGFTPLHEAALRGDGPLVALLLRHGARTDTTDDAGETPADLAARGGHDEVVVLLRG